MAAALVLISVAACKNRTSLSPFGESPRKNHATATVRTHGFNPFRALKYSKNEGAIDYVNANAPKGGDLRLATTDPFNSLNVMNWGVRIADRPPPRLYDLVFETLLKEARDLDLSQYGLVAQDVEWARDLSFVTFHLNPLAKFSNGEPVTADDVVFSYDYIRHTHYYFDKQAWKSVIQAKALDRHTVRFDLTPESEIEGLLTISTLGKIIVFNKRFTLANPRETWGHNGVVPIGSGPYIIDEFLPRRKVVYRHQSNYWANDLMIRKGQFNFDHIVFNVYMDASVARMAMKRGDVDYWLEDKLPEYRALERSLSDLKAERVKRAVSNRFFAIVLNSQNALFKDRRVRLALALTYPFSATNQIMFGGTHAQILSLFNGTEFAHQETLGALERKELGQFEDIPSEAYSPQPNIAEWFTEDNRERLKSALSLFRQAGWNPRDGRLVDPRGTPFRFTLFFWERAYERWFSLFRENLRKVGVQVTLRFLDPTSFTSLLRTHRYEARLTDFTNEPVPESSMLESLLDSRYTFEVDNLHSVGIANPVLDKLVADYREATRFHERVEVARAIDRVVMAESYFIPLGLELYEHLIYQPWLHHEDPMSPRLGTDIVTTWWAEQESPAN